MSYILLFFAPITSSATVYSTNEIPIGYPATHASNGLIINEIHYAPASTAQEFIELLNHSDQPLDLCAFSFSDNRDQKVSVCTGHIELQAEAYVVLARDSAAFHEAFPDVNGLVVFPESWPALNNGGDAVRIYAGDLLVDEVAYTPSWGGLGVSLERIDPAGPSDAAFNWGSSQASAGATPAQQNSIYAPDESPPALLLAEVSDLDTIMLIWNESIKTEMIDPSNFQIGNQAPIALSATSSFQTVLDFQQPISEDEIIYRNIEDLTGNSAPASIHPLAYLPKKNDLLINEIMYAPLADAFDHLPDQPEYVELYNASGRLLSLRGISLTGQPDEDNDADTLRSFAPFPTAIPQSYTLFYGTSKTTAAHTDALSAAFPINFGSELITLLPIHASSLGLLNTGDLITISNNGADPIDAVVYTPDWHHPLLVETRGIALEKRSHQGQTGTHDNWGSSLTASGGTPGIVNSIALNAIGRREPDKAQINQVTIEPAIFSPDQDGINDVLPIYFSSENTSEVIGINVFDINGQLVRTLVESAIVRHEEVFFWDGNGDDGRQLSIGIYIVVVEVLDVLQGNVRVFKKPAVLAMRLE